MKAHRSLKAVLRPAGRLLHVQQTGLVAVILVLGTVLTAFAGTHQDPLTGRMVNNFLNANTLLQTATDASFFAIMAVGATMVIIAGGIDLSVGSVFALSGVTMGLALRAWQPESSLLAVLTGLALSLGMGLLCGLVNGSLMV